MKSTHEIDTLVNDQKNKTEGIDQSNKKIKSKEKSNSDQKLPESINLSSVKIDVILLTIGDN